MSHLRSPRAMIWPTLRAIEISSLARKGGTHLAHCMGSKAGFCPLIAKKTTVRPSVVDSGRSFFFVAPPMSDLDSVGMVSSWVVRVFNALEAQPWSTFLPGLLPAAAEDRS